RAAASGSLRVARVTRTAGRTGARAVREETDPARRNASRGRTLTAPLPRTAPLLPRRVRLPVGRGRASADRVRVRRARGSGQAAALRVPAARAQLRRAARAGARAARGCAARTRRGAAGAGGGALRAG